MCNRKGESRMKVSRIRNAYTLGIFCTSMTVVLPKISFYCLSLVNDGLFKKWSICYNIRPKGNGPDSYKIRPDLQETCALLDQELEAMKCS